MERYPRFKCCSIRCNFILEDKRIWLKVLSGKQRKPNNLCNFRCQSKFQFVRGFGTCSVNSCLVSQLNPFLGHLRRCNQECFSPQTQCFACRLNPFSCKLQFNWENSAESRWFTSRSWQVEKRNAQHSTGKVDLITMSRGLTKGNKNCGGKHRGLALASTPLRRSTFVYNNWNIGVSVCAMDSDCHFPRHTTGMREREGQIEKKRCLFIGLGYFQCLFSAELQSWCNFPVGKNNFNFSLVSFRDD